MLKDGGAYHKARHSMADAEYDRAADHLVVWLRSLECYGDADATELVAIAWRLVWHRWRYLTGRLNDGRA